MQYSQLQRKVTLDDLCTEDKQKIAKLLNEIARTDSEKQKLEGEKVIYHSQISGIIKKKKKGTENEVMDVQLNINKKCKKS